MSVVRARDMWVFSFIFFSWKMFLRVVFVPPRVGLYCWYSSGVRRRFKKLFLFTRWKLSQTLAVPELRIYVFTKVFWVVQRSCKRCFVLCATNSCITSVFTVVEAKLLPLIVFWGGTARYLPNGWAATHWDALPARRGALCMLIGG